MTEESRGMEDQLEEFKGRLAMMRLIHLALVAGVIIFGVVVVVLIRSRMTFEIAFQNPIVVVAVGLAAANIVVASALHRFFFRVGGVPANVGAAVQKYQAFVLVRAAAIEGAALFSAVVTLITCNVLPACLLVLCVGVLIVYRPSQREFVALTSKAVEGDGIAP
jgi:hypothetical protein